MPKVPEQHDVIPFVITDRSATHETRAYVSPLGDIRLEHWVRSPESEILVIGRDSLTTLARIATLRGGK